MCVCMSVYPQQYVLHTAHVRIKLILHEALRTAPGSIIKLSLTSYLEQHPAQKLRGNDQEMTVH